MQYKEPLTGHRPSAWQRRIQHLHNPEGMERNDRGPYLSQYTNQGLPKQVSMEQGPKHGDTSACSVSHGLLWIQGVHTASKRDWRSTWVRDPWRIIKHTNCIRLRKPPKLKK